MRLYVLISRGAILRCALEQLTNWSNWSRLWIVVLFSPQLAGSPALRKKKRAAPTRAASILRGRSRDRRAHASRTWSPAGRTADHASGNICILVALSSITQARIKLHFKYVLVCTEQLNVRLFLTAKYWWKCFESLKSTNHKFTFLRFALLLSAC